MAGYMTKLQGYVYEGEWANGSAAAVANGVLMVPGTSTNNGKLVLPSSADTTTKLLLKEVTDIFDGTTAYRFVVEKLNANYYFVENGYEINTANEYEILNYSTPVGALLRAHPLQVGEEFITTAITGTLTAGTEYGVKTDGTIG